MDPSRQRGMTLPPLLSSACRVPPFFPDVFNFLRVFSALHPGLRQIAALVRLGACAPEVEETAGMIKGLLYSLIDVYETLRMCDDEGGYVARQLAYKYDHGRSRYHLLLSPRCHPLIPYHLPFTCSPLPHHQVRQGPQKASQERLEGAAPAPQEQRCHKCKSAKPSVHNPHNIPVHYPSRLLYPVACSYHGR